LVKQDLSTKQNITWIGSNDNKKTVLRYVSTSSGAYAIAKKGEVVHIYHRKKTSSIVKKPSSSVGKIKKKESTSTKKNPYSAFGIKKK
ncbi:MAG: hypothetical protein JKY54_11315, partial [Flavobacteriales bacterium]|nr:hypothetical protein [Flavobacteriales bacterium]